MFCLTILYVVVILVAPVIPHSFKYCKPKTNEIRCVHGTCQPIKNSSESELTCICDKGWSGPECNGCGGRVR